MIESRIMNKLSPGNTGGVFLRGILMGMADMVPGVSGGTIALITGIYPRLLHAIRSVNRQFVRNILTGRIRKALEVLHIRFLLPLFLGIGTSIVLLSGLITSLLDSYPMLVKGLFLGMVAGSVVSLAKKLAWSIPILASLIFGIGSGWMISVVTPSTTPNMHAFLLFCGFVGITAMLLPGISGAYILLLLGKYEFILEAIHNPLGSTPELGSNLVILGIFGVGCIAGLVAFSRIITWLLKQFHDATMAMLVGVMTGSLKVLWPWEESPLNTLLQEKLFQGILLPTAWVIIGFTVVIVLDIMSTSKQESSVAARP